MRRAGRARPRDHRRRTSRTRRRPARGSRPDVHRGGPGREAARRCRFRRRARRAHRGTPRPPGGMRAWSSARSPRWSATTSSPRSSAACRPVTRSSSAARNSSPRRPDRTRRRGAPESGAPRRRAAELSGLGDPRPGPAPSRPSPPPPAGCRSVPLHGSRTYWRIVTGSISALLCRRAQLSRATRQAWSRWRSPVRSSSMGWSCELLQLLQDAGQPEEGGVPREGHHDPAAGELMGGELDVRGLPGRLDHRQQQTEYDPSKRLVTTMAIAVIASRTASRGVRARAGRIPWRAPACTRRARGLRRARPAG